MGDYDRQPEDWDRYADAPWAPEHVIFCNSKWSGKPDRHQHATVAEVVECYSAARNERSGIPVWPCGWLMEARYDDGSKYQVACEAPTWYTDDRGSYECTVGHSHVPVEVRTEQGWDYAGDEGEACLLARAGVLPVRMDGTGF
jgi:hypothetical protein